MDTNGDNPSNNPIPIHNEINYEQFLLATINNRINSDIITVMLLVRNTTTGERKMKQCKPCITIREIIKILWSNIRLFYTNCRRDIRSYSKINQTVCLLDNTTQNPMLGKHDAELMSKIRERAIENYDPIRQEIVEKYITERMK